MCPTDGPPRRWSPNKMVPRPSTKVFSTVDGHPRPTMADYDHGSYR